MRKFTLVALFCLLSLPAFAQMQSDRQLQWGFIGFVTKFILAGTLLTTVIYGFLLILPSSEQIKFFTAKRRSGRRKKRVAPQTNKNRTLYLRLFYISLVASMIAFYVVITAIREEAKPEPEVVPATTVTP